MSRHRYKGSKWKRKRKIAEKAIRRNAALIEETYMGTPGTRILYKRKVKRP